MRLRRGQSSYKLKVKIHDVTMVTLVIGKIYYPMQLARKSEIDEWERVRYKKRISILGAPFAYLLSDDKKEIKFYPTPAKGWRVLIAATQMVTL